MSQPQARIAIIGGGPGGYEAALVAAQDGGLGVDASRRQVAAEHGLTTRQVEKIEREGLKAEWPPLGE